MSMEQIKNKAKEQTVSIKKKKRKEKKKLTNAPAKADQAM